VQISSGGQTPLGVSAPNRVEHNVAVEVSNLRKSEVKEVKSKLS